MMQSLKKNKDNNLQNMFNNIPKTQNIIIDNKKINEDKNKNIEIKENNNFDSIIQNGIYKY